MWNMVYRQLKSLYRPMAFLPVMSLNPSLQLIWLGIGLAFSNFCLFRFMFLFQALFGMKDKNMGGWIVQDGKKMKGNEWIVTFLKVDWYDERKD